MIDLRLYAVLRPVLMHGVVTCNSCSATIELSIVNGLCDFIHTLFILGTDDIHTLRGCGRACGRISP